MIQRKQVAILTHGLYSEYHPPELDELITGQLKNPRLMDLREQVALVSSVQAYVMEQIKKRQESAREQEGRKNTKRRCLSAKKLAQLVALSDCVSRTIETAARVGPTLRSLVPLETVEQLLREYREIGSKFIRDPSERQRFNHLLSLHMAQIVGEGAGVASREKRGVVKRRRARS